MKGKPMKAKGYGVRITGIFPTGPLSDGLIRVRWETAYEELT
jgi:hypothetical protein